MSLVQPVRYTWAKEDTLATRIGEKGQEKGETRNRAVTESGIQRCDRGVHYRKQVRSDKVERKGMGLGSHALHAACLYVCVVCAPSDSFYT